MKKLAFVFALASSVCWADAYSDAIASHPEHIDAVAWQNTNDVSIAKATAPEELETYLTSDIASAQLLACVKPGYATNPLKATQIAAVSQYVMIGETCPFAFLAFWRRSRDDMRRDWTKELLRAVRSAKEPEVAEFYLDQLRWCGYPEQADEIDRITDGARVSVREMGNLVAAELRAAGARDAE